MTPLRLAQYVIYAGIAIAAALYFILTVIRIDRSARYDAEERDRERRRIADLEYEKRRVEAGGLTRY